MKVEDFVLNKIDKERRPAVLDLALVKAEKIINLDRIKEKNLMICILKKP